MSMGQVTGFSVVDKFGENPDVDPGTPEDVWEGGGLYNYDPEGTAPIVSLIRDNSADTGFPIYVEGIDIEGNLAVQTITINGTNRVALEIPLYRCFRMINMGSSNLTGLVYCYVGTGGVPALVDTRAIINDGNNQTLMALYTVPLGYVGFLYRG